MQYVLGIKLLDSTRAGYMDGRRKCSADGPFLTCAILALSTVTLRVRHGHSSLPSGMYVRIGSITGLAAMYLG